MKKIALTLILASLFSFGGCNVSTGIYDTPGQPFLSIDASKAADSPENIAVHREAIERMDPHVTHREKEGTTGGEFVLGPVTAAQLNMSQELFEALKSVMQFSNEILKTHPKQSISSPPGEGEHTTDQSQ
jgi:hypothetical protein